MSFGTAMAEGGNQTTLQNFFTSRSLLLAHTVLSCSSVYKKQTAPASQQKKEKKQTHTPPPAQTNPKYSQGKKFRLK